MINRRLFQERLDFILGEIQKEELTPLSLEHMQISARQAIEEFELAYSIHIDKNSIEWRILHSNLHVKSVKFSNNKILDTIRFYFLEINQFANNQTINDIVENIEKKQTFFSDEFWNFKKIDDNKQVSKTIFTTRISYLNKMKNIALVVADVEGKKNEQSFLTALKLKPFTKYNVQQSTYKNDFIPKIYWLEACEEKKNNITLSKTLSDILDEHIKNNQESSLWHSIAEETWLKIIRKLQFGIPASWDPEGQNREFIRKSQSLIWTLEQHKDEIEKISYKSYYPFAIGNPLIVNLPYKQLPFNFKKAMLNCFKSYNYEMRLIEFELKNFLDSNSILFCKKDFLKDQNPNLFMMIFEKYTFKKGYSDHKVLIINDFVTIEPYAKHATTLKEVFSGKNVNVLLAPAGHGKTTFVKNKVIADKVGEFLVVTPTHKAKEVYSDLSVEKTTIQNLVANGDRRNKNYIFDEISMYTNEHWEFILKLIKQAEENKKFYLVGDENQLEPIGERNHFYLIKNHAKKIPDLKDNKRLIEAVKGEKESNLKLFNDVLKNDLIDNFYFKDYKNKFILYDTYTELFKAINEKINYLNDKGDNFKIIVEKNNGIVSVNNFNRWIVSKDGPEFSEGAEIIFSEDVPGRKDLYVGQIKKIKKIENSFHDGIEISKIFFSDDSLLTVYDGDYPFSHSLTITAHKSQGQTYDSAIIVIDKNQLVNKKWLYTAISRIRKEVIIFIPSIEKLILMGEHSYDEESLKFFQK